MIILVKSENRQPYKSTALTTACKDLGIDYKKIKRKKFPFTFDGFEFSKIDPLDGVIGYTKKKP